jgi:hypothetical protein
MSICLVLLTLMQSCNAQDDHLYRYSDVRLEEPEARRLTSRTVVQEFAEYGYILTYSQWEDYFLLYNSTTHTLSRTIIVTDELARMIFPKPGEPAREYRFSSDSIQTMLLPYTHSQNMLKPEIMAARMVSKTEIGCIAFVRGPMTLSSMKGGSSIGIIPVFFIYDIEKTQVSKVIELLPWFEDFIWNSAILSDDCKLVYIGMQGESGTNSENMAMVFRYDIASGEHIKVFTASTAAPIKGEYVYNCRGDSLLFSPDHRSIFLLHREFTVLMLPADKLEAQFVGKEIRISSLSMENNNSIVLGLFVRDRDGGSELFSVTIDSRSELQVHKEEASLRGMILSYRPSQQNCAGSVIWMDDESVYRRILSTR